MHYVRYALCTLHYVLGSTHSVLLFTILKISNNLRERGEIEFYYLQSQTLKREEKSRFRQFTQYFSSMICYLFQSRASIREQQFLFTTSRQDRKIENHFCWSIIPGIDLVDPPNMHFWVRQIWSSGVSLKRSCKSQFRCIVLRSIGLSIQKFKSQFLADFPILITM